jgi:hypothetical protein
MTDQSVFQTNTPPEQTPAPEASQTPEVKQESTPAPAVNPYEDLLKGIVTEDGRQKYATVSDAINALPHAQSHISKLEQENSAMREQLEKAKGVDEVLQQLNKGQAQETPSVQGLDEATAAKLFQQMLAETEEKGRIEANLHDADAAMRDKFGDKAKDVMAAKAQELGVGAEFMKSMAAESPAAFKQLFGIDKKGPQGSGHVTSSINTTQMVDTPISTEEAPKSVMGSGKTSDIVAAWNRIGEQVKANQS